MSQTDVVQERTVSQPLSNGIAQESGQEQSGPPAWKQYEKIAFRIAFVFFISICIPNNPAWYKHVVNIDWTKLHYRDLYDIARFGSGLNFFGNTLFGSNLNGYANWITTLIVAIIAGLIWSFVDRRLSKPAREYNLLYYWLRAVVRYRAGIGIIGFGFTKLLPVQMPYPSEALLNTNFGDFTAQKIYWMSIGIVPWYQVFAGVVELTAGVLLFFRGTAALGAALLIAALGTITYVNFAYDGGVHVYASYFVLLSAFILAYYVPRIYSLFILERFTVPLNYYPAFSRPWQYYTRVFLKSATIFVFLILFFYLQWVNFRYDPYKQPSVKGITALRGSYDVAEFRLNNEVIPYSPLDPVRWQEITFEKWTTLTYKVNQAFPLDLSNGGGDPQRDINRTFEIAGVGGGRRVFHYYADTIDQVLYLQDKYKALPDRRNVTAGAGGDRGRSEERVANENVLQQQRTGIYADDWISATAWQHIGDEVGKIDKRAASARRDREFAAEGNKFDKRKRMVLNYETTDDSEVVLRGVNEDQDSLYIVLKRVDKAYALSRSTLDAGKY